jgi:hypothetical protein
MITLLTRELEFASMQRHHLALGFFGTFAVIALIAFAFNQDEIAAIIQGIGLGQVHNTPQPASTPAR